MSDADIILPGLLIGGFSCICLAGIGLYIRGKHKKFHMKKSASSDQLSGSDLDPQLIGNKV
jgi:hypothetical protein